MNAPLRSRQLVRLELPKPARPPRRRRRRGDREADKALHNHATERWMISYADFITLLFAFFVVMYAMSSVNEGRYRVLSGSLSTAFSPVEGQPGSAVSSTGGPVAGSATNAPVKVDQPAVDAPKPVEPPAEKVAEKAPEKTPEPAVDPVERAEMQKNAERVQRMQKLASDMDNHLQSLVHDGQVKVTRGARGIAIEISASVLFDPAHADLKPASFGALKEVADVLSHFVEPLQVEGHSDDIPISTREFKSNWELSAARASSVARFLIDQGVAPSRIGVAGYAEFRPLVGNSSPEARARNRRVTLVVLSADDTRPKEGLATPEAPGPSPEPAAALEPPAPSNPL